jgi:hypothetical protein
VQPRSHQLGQAAADAQAQAGAAELAGRLAAGLHVVAEQALLLLGADADAGVADRELDAWPRRLARQQARAHHHLAAPG